MSHISLKVCSCSYKSEFFGFSLKRLKPAVVTVHDAQLNVICDGSMCNKDYSLCSNHFAKPLHLLVPVPQHNANDETNQHHDSCTSPCTSSNKSNIAAAAAFAVGTGGC
jgi:hypothetical protein